MGRDLLHPDAQPVTPAASASAWNLIKDSLDADDYVEFQMHFAGAPEVILAGRHRRQLDAWSALRSDDVDALTRLSEGGLFDALAKRVSSAIAALQKSLLLPQMLRTGARSIL